MRIRIAHHEPICFGQPVCVDVQDVRECYDKMMRLFHWMDIDANTLLYGLDHVDRVCADIIGI